MKEIKAYIRPEKIAQVVRALETAGFKDMTIIDVHALGTLCDPERFAYSVEFVERHSRIVKLEMVVDDEKLGNTVRIILENAHSGLPGDGVLFVTDIHAAYRIRTREFVYHTPDRECSCHHPASNHGEPS